MKIKYTSAQTKWVKSLLSLFTLLLIATVPALAQNNGIEMADRMREDGKIWVVVGVIVLIFLGIITYLISLDRKISKLEKQMKQN